MTVPLGDSRIPRTARTRRRMTVGVQLLAILAILTSLLSGAFPTLVPVAAAAPGPSAAAVTFTVTDTNDAVDADLTTSACNTGTNTCTLRAAIQQANALAATTPAETFTIDLAAGATYMLTLTGSFEDAAATGDLDMLSNVTINGNGATVNGNGTDRVFQIFSTVGDTANVTTVSINDLTVTNGNSGDAFGGGILNEDFDGAPELVAADTIGALTLNNVNVIGNRTGFSGPFTSSFSSLGGGIYNGFSRTLIVNGGTIADNRAGAGGGLFNEGTATLTDSNVRANAASGFLLNNGNGLGGGILNTDTLTLTNTTVTANGAFIGGGVANISMSDVGVRVPSGARAAAIGTLTIRGGSISNNTASFYGGGIANGLSDPSVLDVTGTTIAHNVAAGFSILLPISQGFQLTAGGNGGGIGNTGLATVRQVAFNGNSATSYGGDNEFLAGAGGGAGNIGTLTIDSSTFSGNGISGPGYGGGIANGILIRFAQVLTVLRPSNNASLASVDTQLIVSNSTFGSNNAPTGGGALFNVDDSAATLTNVTVANNQTGLLNSQLTNNTSPPPPPPPPVIGQEASLSVQNSIVANNADYNCSGTIVNGGYNIDSAATCAFAAANNSLSNTDPKLGPLALNALGTTQTYALQMGSPALDRVPSGGAGCPAVDQRGVTRPQGPGCDVGAYESETGSFNVTISTSGPGTLNVAPGTYNYLAGSTQSFTATPNANNVAFIGWTVDGTFVGFGNPLALPVTKDRTVVATFAAIPTFCDVTPSTPGAVAINQLAARGVIFGSDNPNGPGKCFLPGDTLYRIHVAGMVARAFGWDQEDHGNAFTDQGSVDNDLWRNAGTLAFYDVARGYRDGTYDPTGPVLHAQAVSFATRAMVRKGYWTLQEDNAAYYSAVPNTSSHRQDAVTFYTYAGNIPGTAAPTDPWDGPTGYDQPSTRTYFAQVLWQAYSSYFSVNHIP